MGKNEIVVFEEQGAFCPVYHRAVELIGRRWTGAILRALLAGVNRFSDLVATVPGMSDRMLSERLKELEAEGVLEKRQTPISISGSPAEFNAYVRSEMKRWDRVIRENNVKID